ncbi:peptidoglycan L-alanyl-D-glutamate endopeptidase [Elizabethkingia meningoseptica]|uniref:M15 family metallopeptidase n=1 Tax=Elizabethkingia meningoseptica TaxID=238 RepID=UPI000332C855|nr:M15 family metallopeptidase [Elizabethkingia meningoseptica]AQX06870.1 peptidoglycan L-alanyl-D-glutamate endopeptidase [Elizabethkingia meningoseptica]AQX48916.1 peptidoglycan L-alanyl-D-glutamate endopeptidase [Elizabethkingia meningoseptica]EOR29418.1 peptidase m15b and m15c dd-carboxypeptidase vany/endolysin [Elizabethkingia meningoseptica ATCC 13253 = NBRC 12535]KUY15002.1 peptidoglycan L-alanyl-D-glutamate endopeptidase [Elizabethkingia meningoseptica]MDE5488448.1 M15 family metallope
MDKVTLANIEKLHPMIREEVKQIIKECDTALTGRAKIRITQGFRTFQEQAKLYAQGRTLPGKKVTNARPGQSIHNYGLAVDMCLVIDGKTISWDIAKDWDNDRIADWKECVNVFAKYGWEWGGSWKTFKDYPHFEKKRLKTRYGLLSTNWKVLAKLPRDKSGYVII